MKRLIAERAKDGWYVKVIETHLLPTLTDVYSLARHEGLRNDKTSLNEVFITPSYP